MDRTTHLSHDMLHAITLCKKKSWRAIKHDRQKARVGWRGGLLPKLGYLSCRVNVATGYVALSAPKGHLVTKPKGKSQYFFCLRKKKQKKKQAVLFEGKKRNF